MPYQVIHIAKIKFSENVNQFNSLPPVSRIRAPTRYLYLGTSTIMNYEEIDDFMISGVRRHYHEGAEDKRITYFIKEHS